MRPEDPGRPLKFFFAGHERERGCAAAESSPAAQPLLSSWSLCPGLNWRPRPYQGRALPTELQRHFRYVNGTLRLRGRFVKPGIGVSRLFPASRPVRRPESLFRQEKPGNQKSLRGVRRRGSDVRWSLCPGLNWRPQAKRRKSSLFLSSPPQAGRTSALRPSCRYFSSSFLPMKTRQVPVRPSGGLRQLISSPTTSR